MFQNKTPGLLISMAMRSNHAFAAPFTTEAQQVQVIEHVNAFYDKVVSQKTYVATDDAITFKQLCEEMSGEGFYRPEFEVVYRAYAKLDAMAKALEFCK